MTVSDIKKLAAQGRQAFRKTLAERRTTPKDPVLPVPVGVIDPADGTIGRPYNYAALKVSIQRWTNTPNPGEDNEVFLFWAPGRNPSDGVYQQVDKRLIDGNNLPGFPLEMNIPLEVWRDTEGAFSIKYDIRLANGITDHSGVFSAIRDTKAPYADADEPEPLKLILPTELEDADLDAAEPTGVEAEIPDYPDYQPKDKIAYWWVTEVPSFDPNDPNAPLPIANVSVPDDRKIYFPVDYIRDKGDGGCFVAYTLFDKAGNRTPLSHPTEVGVAIGVMPSNFQNPSVPQSQPKGFVNQKDALDGIYVVIEEFTPHKPTDNIEVTWGQSKLTAEPIGSSPTWPKRIKVPEDVLIKEYDWSNGGRIPTPIGYRFLRGTVPRGPFTSSVDVYFSVPGPGPDNPIDWPDPVNADMTPGEVFGKSTPGQPNVLVRADDGEDATFEFTFYDDTTADVGKVIEFYWGAYHVEEADIQLKGNEGGEDETVTIPWKYIYDEGNDPKVLVHYRIRDKTSDNWQRSPYTEVNVNAVVYRPDAPEFEGVNEFGFLACPALYDPPYTPGGPNNPDDPSVRLRIPDLSKDLGPGETLTLKWVAYQHSDPTDGEIAAEYELPVTLGPDWPVTGFVWRIGYDAYVKPIYIPTTSPGGRARATYSFVDKTGETVTSKCADIKVGMYESDEPCPIPPRQPTP
ncbi:hypothetical protein ACMGT0_23315 [Pseudomonas sp. RHF3.3-3]|uniref:hypothetical protein n=1 Tax=Pseudomonas sp. RHF3.3-3 TaxID=3396624 RepID=UPI003A8ACD5B